MKNVSFFQVFSAFELDKCFQDLIISFILMPSRFHNGLRDLKNIGMG